MSIEKVRLELSERLKAVRKLWKITQKEMAERMGIGLSTYQYYERQERDIPAVTLLSLTALGINPVWLSSGAGEIEVRTPNGSIDFTDASHAELVKEFKQKDIAKEINRLLIEIEKVDPGELHHLKELLEFKLSKKMEQSQQTWPGVDRRKTGR